MGRSIYRYLGSEKQEVEFILDDFEGTLWNRYARHIRKTEDRPPMRVDYEWFTDQMEVLSDLGDRYAFTEREVKEDLLFTKNPQEIIEYAIKNNLTLLDAMRAPKE